MKKKLPWIIFAEITGVGFSVDFILHHVEEFDKNSKFSVTFAENGGT